MLRKALVVRVVAIAALSAYTIVALAHDAYRALPLVLLELCAGLYVLFARVPRLCDCVSLGGSEHVPRRRAHLRQSSLTGLGASVVALHLIVVAALGARSGERWRPVLGLATILGGCYAGSRDRRAVRWRPICAGLLLQFWVCVLLLRTPIGLAAVRWAACEVSALLGYARVGAVFVFGAEAVASTWALRVPTA